MGPASTSPPELLDELPLDEPLDELELDELPLEEPLLPEDELPEELEDDVPELLDPPLDEDDDEPEELPLLPLLPPESSVLDPEPPPSSVVVMSPPIPRIALHPASEASETSANAAHAMTNGARITIAPSASLPLR
jgi:hypothetical protein